MNQGQRLYDRLGRRHQLYRLWQPVEFEQWRRGSGDLCGWQCWRKRNHQETSNDLAGTNWVLGTLNNELDSGTNALPAIWHRWHGNWFRWLQSTEHHLYPGRQ